MTSYSLLPLLPPFLLVLSVGIGVTSSERIDKVASYTNMILTRVMYNNPKITFAANVKRLSEDNLKKKEQVPMRPIFMPERARALSAD